MRRCTLCCLYVCISIAVPAPAGGHAKPLRALTPPPYQYHLPDVQRLRHRQMQRSPRPLDLVLTRASNPYNKLTNTSRNYYPRVEAKLYSSSSKKLRHPRALRLSNLVRILNSLLGAISIHALCLLHYCTPQFFKPPFRQFR